MNAKQSEKLLIDLNACEDGRAWAKGKTLKKVWATLDRADWMLWLVGKMADKPGWPIRKEVVNLACDCAETALPIWEKKFPTDKRPHIAIQAARDYMDGKIILEELKEKRRAAYAAAYAAAAYAAYAAAAYAAYTAYTAADAADTADTAADAAYTADTAADAAYTAADAAYTADTAAAAAYTAADAAYTADTADTAAAAAYTAADAAYTADTAADADAARKKAHIKMCEIIRNKISLAEVK